MASDFDRYFSDPNGRNFAALLIEPDDPVLQQFMRDSKGGPMGHGADYTEEQWLRKSLQVIPGLSTPDGQPVNLLMTQLLLLVQYSPCYQTLSDLATKKKSGITFVKLLDIVRPLPDLKGPDLDGVQGLYILLDMRKQEVQLGQSGDLAAMAKDLAQTKYKDYLQRVLLRFPPNYPRTLSSRLPAKKLYALVLDQIKRPARFSDSHQPMKDEKDDVKQRMIMKDYHRLLAYACMHDAHYKAAREMGPLVPPLTLEQPEEKIKVLLDILSPVIERCEPLRSEPRQVITLFRQACGMDGGQGEPMMRALQEKSPWDPRGAEMRDL